MAKRYLPIRVAAQLGQLDRALARAQDAAGSMLTEELRNDDLASYKIADDAWTQIEAVRRRIATRRS
jgi:hypothetical protein